MALSLERQRSQIDDRQFRTSRVEVSGDYLGTQHRCDLEVDQFGCGQ